MENKSSLNVLISESEENIYDLEISDECLDVHKKSGEENGCHVIDVDDSKVELWQKALKFSGLSIVSYGSTICGLQLLKFRTQRKTYFPNFNKQKM